MNMITRLGYLGTLGMLLLNLHAFSAYAWEDEHPIPPPHPTPCPSPTMPPCPEQKQEHFNIQCTFSDHDHDHDKDSEFKKCKVNAEFEKMVTLDGGEVTDDSVFPFNPKFEVECDGKWLQKDHSRRFTEILGTRIQAEQGPFPALVLPRGELHVGPHYSRGSLEFDNNTMHGSCFIYTGQALKDL